MKDIPLADWVAERTQAEAAELIGCNQSAVSQMLRSERQIFVRVNKRGAVMKVWEERPVGNRRKPVEMKETA